MADNSDQESDDEDKKGIERSNRGGWHSKNFNITDKNSIQHKFAVEVQKYICIKTLSQFSFKGFLSSNV